MANKFDTEITVEKKEVDFNPLDEAVNEKKYSQPTMNTQGVDMTKPIEEPKFTPPPFHKKTNVPPPQQEKREPLNPEMKSIPKKETEMASAQAAKLIINGYEWMHDLANKGLKVSEKKLNKLQADGEINLNAEIDYDYGKTIRAGEFFQEYNQQIDGLLKVSQEFKDEVTPVLERVLAKRGIGLTDEQFLMYLFGKDIAAKSIIFFQQKQQVKMMIESIKESTISSPSLPRERQQPTTPQPQPQPTPPQDPTPKSKSNNANNFNYSTFPPFESDDEINERESVKDAKEEDEYIFNSKRKNSKEDEVVISILNTPPKKRGRPKK